MLSISISYGWLWKEPIDFVQLNVFGMELSDVFFQLTA